MCAWVTSAHPSRDSYVTVYGRLAVGERFVTGAPMTTTWHFKTVTREVQCATGWDGIGRCTYYISGATAGWQVWVDVRIEHGGRGYEARRWFAPE